jgi:hypothetical protein
MDAQYDTDGAGRLQKHPHPFLIDIAASLLLAIATNRTQTATANNDIRQLNTIDVSVAT